MLFGIILFRFLHRKLWDWKGTPYAFDALVSPITLDACVIRNGYSDFGSEPCERPNILVVLSHLSHRSYSLSSYPFVVMVSDSNG